MQDETLETFATRRELAGRLSPWSFHIVRRLGEVE